MRCSWRAEGEDFRKGNPAAQDNLAELSARNGHPKEAVRRFELAVAAGFRDLAGAAADPDVAGLKGQKFRAEYAVKPALTALVWTTPGRGTGPTVEVTNTGQLPPVDAALFLTTDPKNAAAPLARRTVEYLAPGVTYYWVDADKTGGPDGPVFDFLAPRPGGGKESPGLVVELPHRLAPGGRKPKPLPFEVRAGKYTPFRYGC